MLVAGAQIIQNSQYRLINTLVNTVLFYLFVQVNIYIYIYRSGDISVNRPLLPISPNDNLQRMESSPITASRSLLHCKPLLSHERASPLKLPSLARTRSHPTGMPRPVRSTAPLHKRVKRHTETQPDSTQFQDLFVGSHVTVPTAVHPSTAKVTLCNQGLAV